MGASAASPVTVTGLTNRKHYTCTVAATNDRGTSAISDPSNAIVPASTPTPPTGVTVTSGNATASVAFTSSADDGGSPITSYRATCTSSNSGVTGTTAGTTSPIVVSGITNGHTYQCTATATNAIGTSAASSPSTTFVPATVPGAPSGVTGALAGSGGAKVAWTAPTDGGSAITGYRITPYAQGVAQRPLTFNSFATTQTLTGLQNAKSYQFTVDAMNVVGHGAASGKSVAIIVGVPGSPGKPKVTKVASKSLKVTWTAAANNGAAISQYNVTCKSSNGGVTKTKSGKASPITVGTLTAGKSYTCRVTATNSRGTGAASAASAAVKA